MERRERRSTVGRFVIVFKKKVKMSTTAEERTTEAPQHSRSGSLHLEAACRKGRKGEHIQRDRELTSAGTFTSCVASCSPPQRHIEVQEIHTQSANT